MRTVRAYIILLGLVLICKNICAQSFDLGTQQKDSFLISALYTPYLCGIVETDSIPANIIAQDANSDTQVIAANIIELGAKSATQIIAANVVAENAKSATQVVDTNDAEEIVDTLVTAPLDTVESSEIVEVPSASIPQTADAKIVEIEQPVAITKVQQPKQKSTSQNVVVAPVTSPVISPVVAPANTREITNAPETENQSKVIATNQKEELKSLSTLPSEAEPTAIGTHEQLVSKANSNLKKLAKMKLGDSVIYTNYKVLITILEKKDSESVCTHIHIANTVIDNVISNKLSKSLLEEKLKAANDNEESVLSAFASFY